MLEPGRCDNEEVSALTTSASADSARCRAASRVADDGLPACSGGRSGEETATS